MNILMKVYLDIYKLIRNLKNLMYLTLLKFSNQGIHPSIRGEVWEFLLGCYDPKSTFEERDEIRQRRR